MSTITIERYEDLVAGDRIVGAEDGRLVVERDESTVECPGCGEPHAPRPCEDGSACDCCRDMFGVITVSKV